MSLQEYKACIDRKTSSHAGRRAPHDHPDLNSNAFSKICSALPEGTAMHNARVACILLAGLFSPFLFPLLASAAVDCGILPQWVTLGNGMELNQQHVFCGEWSASGWAGGLKAFIPGLARLTHRRSTSSGYKTGPVQREFIPVNGLIATILQKPSFHRCFPIIAQWGRYSIQFHTHRHMPIQHAPLLRQLGQNVARAGRPRLLATNLRSIAAITKYSS